MWNTQDQVLQCSQLWESLCQCEWLKTMGIIARSSYSYVCLPIASGICWVHTFRKVLGCMLS